MELKIGRAGKIGKKKQVIGALLTVAICLVLSFEGKAQTTVEESLCQSISFSTKGSTIEKIYVINKTHDLWSYEYGKTEKEFIISDAAQVGNRGRAVLKTDGTLWEYSRTPYLGAGWSDLDTMDWKCTEENLQKLPYDYSEWTDRNGQRLPYS